MAPIERTFRVHSAVLERVDQMPLTDRIELAELMARIRVSPRDPEAGVRPMIQGAPQSYTAPFDRALLLYQVLADHPVIHLLQITDLPESD